VFSGIFKKMASEPESLIPSGRLFHLGYLYQKMDRIVKIQSFIFKILSKYYIVSKRVDTTFITPLICLKAHFSVVIVLDGNFLLVFTFRFKCFMDNVVNNSARKTFTLCSNIPCSNIPCSNYSMFKLFHVNIGQTLVNLLHLCFRLLCYYNSV